MALREKTTSITVELKNLVSVHLLEKWRHFFSPKTLLRFRVRVG